MNNRPRQPSTGTSSSERPCLRALLFVVLFLPMLSGCQSKFVYFPEKEMRGDPSERGLRYEEVFFETEDHVRLSGWWVPSPKERGVLLFCHGNGGNISDRLGFIELFHQMDLSTFIFDYRGYGRSEGRPCEEGTYRDAAAAWQYLVEARNISPGRIILYGRSLGGAIAAWAARHHPPGMLIIDSSFTSLQAVARERFPWLPSGLILTYRYDTRQHLTGVRCPALIVHRRQDGLIPFSQGEELYQAAPWPKAFLVIDGTHNALPAESFRHFKEGLASFVNEHLKRKGERDG